MNDAKNKVILMDSTDYIPWDKDELIVAVAGAGSVIAINFIIEMVMQHGKELARFTNNLPEVTHLLNRQMAADAFVVTTKNVYRVDLNTFISAGGNVMRTGVIKDQKTVAIGSGHGALYIAYDTFKLSAVDAMRFARLTDRGTGGSILSYTRQPDGSLRQNESIPHAGQDEDFNHIRQLIADMPMKRLKKHNPSLYGNSTHLRSLARTISRRNKPRVRLQVSPTGELVIPPKEESPKE